MNSLRDQIVRAIGTAIPVLFVAAASFGVYLAVSYFHLPSVQRDIDAASESVDRLEWQETTMPPAEAWRIFSSSTNAEPSAGSGAGRFRLAGTFFRMPDEPGGESIRKAVLDDTRANTQLLVQEGESVDDITVRRIFRDHVVIAGPSGEETLWLRFERSRISPSAPDGSEDEVPAEPKWDEVTLEESAFGRRIAENRWILQRKELLAYREELLDDPERLAALFISMKADRVDKKIDGYRLQQQGEEEFWKAVGLQEDDVIRRVNSMKMTRQERAEYFIREFVSDRLNAVVLDIERNGQPQKLIYYLRE